MKLKLLILSLLSSLPLAAQVVGINGVPGQTITGLPAQGGSSPQILAGCGVQYVSGLTYTVGDCFYFINNQQYHSTLQNVTLTTADPTNPRIDLIYLDASLTPKALAGTPSPDPVEPSTDPATQLGLRFALIPAGSTTPANVTVTNIYLDGGEWAYTTNLNVNALSTNFPYQGIYDVEFGAGGNAQRNSLPSTSSNVIFTVPSSGTVNLSNYNYLIFYVRNKAAWPNQCSVSMQWFDATGSALGSGVLLNNGTFGFNALTNNTGYQQIQVPINAFGATARPASRIGFYVAGFGCSWTGFYMDFVTIQGGVNNVPPPTTIMNFKGTWNATASYNANDTVVSGGIGYVALVANTNTAVTNGLTWAALGAVTSSGGFPITLGTTPIPANSTTTSLSGLTINGVALSSAGSTSLFLNQAGAYAVPTGLGDTITSPGSTLTVGGTATNTTLDLNLGQGNIWTAAQTFNLGLTIGSGHSLANTAVADGCGTWATGVLGSTGVPCGSGSGTVTGSGTTGFIPKWTSSSALGNSLLDYGVTVVNQFNFGASVNVSDASHPSTFTLAYNSGHPPSVGSAGNFVIGPDVSGNLDVSEGGSALSRVCTAANAATNTGCQSGGGGSPGGSPTQLQYNNTTFGGIAGSSFVSPLLMVPRFEASWSNTNYAGGPGTYEQAMIDNPATTGTATQTQLGICGYNGTTDACDGWVGRTSHTFTFAPYTDAIFLESDSAGGLVILSDDPTNGGIKFFTGGYTSNGNQSAAILPSGIFNIGTQGTTITSGGQLNVESAPGGANTNLDLVSENGKELLVLTNDSTDAKQQIYTSFESGGSEEPLQLGTFTNRLTPQIDLDPSGCVAIGGTCNTASQFKVNGAILATSNIQTNTILVAGGTQSISGCTNSSPVGGASAGAFTSGVTGTCTVVITPGITAAHGFRCEATDMTTPADLIGQTTYTVTTCTISGSTLTNDVITWQAIAF